MTWNGSTAPCHTPEEPRVAPSSPAGHRVGTRPANAASRAINHRA